MDSMNPQVIVMTSRVKELRESDQRKREEENTIKSDKLKTESRTEETNTGQDSIFNNRRPGNRTNKTMKAKTPAPHFVQLIAKQH